MTTENDVYRAAQDVGLAVKNSVMHAVAAAVGNGTLSVDEQTLQKLQALVDDATHTAYRGAINSYYKVFESYKNEAGNATSPK